MDHSKKKKIFILVLIGALVISLAFNFKLLLGDGVNQSKIVATIGAEKITQEDLSDFLVEQSNEQDIEAFIANELIQQEAKKQGLHITEKELNAEYDRIVSQYGEEKVLVEQLKKDGSSLETFKNEMANYLLTTKLVSPSIKITEQQIESYFNENKEEFQQREKVQASHILTADQSKANQLYKKLKGKDLKTFSEIAEKESEDDSTAKKGGRLGYFDDRQMDEAFTKIAFHTEIGTISKPVKSAFGWHIIYVTGKKKKEDVMIDVVRPEILKELKRLAIPKAYADWLASKKKEYNVEIKG